MTPNHRSAARSSFFHSRIANTSIKTPSDAAITRCENSNSAPPVSVSSGGNQLPCDFGQSGTDNAASCDVTSAPATKSRTDQQTTKTASLCTAALEVDASPG